MKITKVKVADKMVLMHRTTQNGKLIYQHNSDDITGNLLPNEKMDSFRLSVLNKTIVKKVQPIRCDKCGEKRCRNCNDNFRRAKTMRSWLESFFRNLLEGKKLDYSNPPSDEKIITLCLGHKFREEVVFDGGKFNLTKCIIEAKTDDKALDIYIQWVKDYINTKCKYLTKSIRNNAIVVEDTEFMSKRKIALKKWECEYLVNYKVDFSQQENMFKLDDLSKEFSILLENEKDFNGNRFEFHRKLKLALQKHQKRVFGTRDNPKNRISDSSQVSDELLLAEYNQEVVKYLEHYFPIKKSNRSYNEKEYCEYYLNAKTVKSTISKQILNALKAGLIQKGKKVTYNLDASTNSTILQDIKVEETFVLKIIDACSFAANNIRNIIDPKQSKDIIGKKPLEFSISELDSTEKKASALAKFHLFYNTKSALNIIADDIEEYLWGIRGSVQAIRNDIFHYKKESLRNIFKVTEFESNPNNIEYKQSKFKDFYKDELDRVPKLFAEGLKSAGILSYYKPDDINNLISTNEFTPFPKLIPYTCGFGKVIKEGWRQQKAAISKINAYNLELEYYFEPSPDKEEYQAKYSIYKLIYRNLFLPQFACDRQLFKEASDFVLQVNKQYNTIDKQAFAAIRPFGEKEDQVEYLSYLHGELLIEQKKKEAGANKNYDKFSKQLFVKGFDIFLRNLGLKFIQSPIIQSSKDLNNKAKEEELNKLENELSDFVQQKFQGNYSGLDHKKSSQIAFYVFCKLLDTNQLNELKNEFIKYRQSQNSEDFDYLIKIIELCLLSSDNIYLEKPEGRKELSGKYEANKRLKRIIKKCIRKKYAEHLKPFVEDNVELNDFGDLFLQSDSESIVRHSGIELIKKYGTNNILEDLSTKCNLLKIKKEEYLRWSDLKLGIAEKVKRRDELHQAWVKEKKKDLLGETINGKQIKIKHTNKAQKYLTKHRQEYLECCNFIDEYTNLDGKLHFLHLRKLHSLLIDILGRFVGYAAIWERDFIFFDAKRINDDYSIRNLISFSDLQRELESQTISLISIEAIKEGKIVKKNGVNIEESDKCSLINEFKEKRDYRKTFFEPRFNVYDIRNYIAHLNYLTTSASKSLLEMSDELRKLLYHDRKLKNAVVKSLIKIFDSYGMILQLKFDNHNLQVESIEPKKIIHMEDEQIVTNQVTLDFCTMCKMLLELKK